MTTGRWWWFVCKKCDRRCIRFCNAKVCRRCWSRSMERQRVATPEEQNAQYEEVIRKFNETPE